MLKESEHLEHDNNIIAFLWLGFISILILWTVFEAPLSFALQHSIQEHHLWIDGILSFIFFLDVYFKYTSKYQLPEYRSLGDYSAKDGPEYKKSKWFIIDLITSLPFDIIAYSMQVFLGFGQVVTLIRMLRLLRFARIVKLRPFLILKDFFPKIFKVGMIFTGIIFALHLIACGWMLVNDRTSSDDLTFYNISLYWAITTLTTVGYGDITPNSNSTRVYTMMVMLIGVGVYGVVIGNFSRLMMLADKYTEDKKEKMKSLHQFMKFYSIPRNLQKEVFAFYSHILEKKLTEEDNLIVKELPLALQNELSTFMKIKLIKNLDVFEGCSTGCLSLIAKKLEQSFYSPEEHIIKKGDVGEEMYIISHGDVSVYQEDKVIAEMKAGDFFGEIALMQDTIRTADVRANTYCDLYILKLNDFLEIIEKYPALGESFHKVYTQRVA